MTQVRMTAEEFRKHISSGGSDQKPAPAADKKPRTPIYEKAWVRYLLAAAIGFGMAQGDSTAPGDLLGVGCGQEELVIQVVGEWGDGQFEPVEGHYFCFPLEELGE